MTTTEDILRERIKELTCLYEVSSIIVNTTLEEYKSSLQAIATSLKRAFQIPKSTHIAIETALQNYKTGAIDPDLNIQATITVFNKKAGSITASLLNTAQSFLQEEKQLLESVALKLGNLIERLEIQRNEVSLKQQMQHADRLSILGELTAGIAHELNTPLANILGYAELLKENSTYSTTATSDLDKIIQNAIFSREVVKKLMFFACEMPQTMKTMDIVPNIKNALNLLDPSLRKAQVSYKLDLPEQLLLKADPIQFTQIIFNLVMNAMYFSPKESTITISAKQVNNHVQLTVKDEGSGIAKTVLKKIFQPFVTTKTTGQGSGLGLSVVHGIVNSHKGTITATNNLETGATFTIILPMTTC